MIFTTETHDGIALFKLAGKLVFEEPLFLIRPKVRELLQSGIRSFVFDFGRVPYCDSSGCGEVIGVYTAIAREEANVAFIHLAPKVRTLWERIHLTDTFDVFETLEQAQDYFKRSARR